ncbi:type VI secretion system lipoprotein TssJ [Amphritea pacifica]|uniref:Type VI secretion system lipoprotein TssJ n=1 Tax=Amphritea pacifica TaxID=2811233 RepID=A0ABS2W5R4_9GAMM|nr:type VI secretion system lipoprotein TssJ [Amphritea pacifica]MBN0986931.1 type VI secretion system lipoprotein TssJ [Amphritea pacifica]
MFQGFVERYWRQFIMLFIASSIISGCSTVSDMLSEDEPPPPPPELVVSVIADSGVNQDLDGRPSPTVVRIYQLEDDALFKESDFFALYDSDSAMLSGDLLLRDELIVNPGGSAIKKTLLDKDTEFVGVLAAFQNTENGVMKKVVAVNAEKDQSVQVRLKDNQLTLDLLD